MGSQFKYHKDTLQKFLMHVEHTKFSERLQKRPEPIMFMDVKKKWTTIIDILT